MKNIAYAFFIFIFLTQARLSFAINSFIESPLNPIFSPQPSNWDSFSIQNPVIIQDVSDYKMWYEGNSGLGWRIGFASSVDGINWVRLQSPIIPVGSPDGTETYTENPYVIFNPDLNLYQMWYSSNRSNWTGGDDRFRLRYATSSDGINWLRSDNFVLHGTPNSWDSGGITRGLSVIYRNGLYQMWYSGTDSGFNWKIGYATSIDGISWVKQNNGNPIISPTETWEQSDINYPRVRYKNGIYEMFYASAPSDAPNKIIYATSTDGIIWNKNYPNPILVGTKIGFDTVILSSPSTVLLDNGTTLLFFSGNAFAMGLATDGPLPTATPMPSSSPTLTPSFTPTPTPSPTPVPTKKIVIVPGMGGSWNLKELDSCSYDPNNTNWGQTLEYYTPLRTRLANDGFVPYIFPYDWRRPISENGAKLEQFINGIAAANEKINVVGHSMGGLVARWYLEHTKFSNKIDALLTVGTPHNGSNLSYPAWAAGEGWSNSIITRAMYSYIKFSCSVQKKYSAVETTHTMIPSFKNTLPVYNFLKDRKTNTIKQISSQIIQNDWLPTSYYGNPFYGVRVGSLAGFGYQTHLLYLTNPPTKKEISSNMWLDGKPSSIDMTELGDGTVLNSSSYVPGAQNWTINLDHGALVRDISGINEISSFFSPSANAFSPLRMKIPDARNPHKRIPTSALMIISNSGHFTITDPKSTQITDSNGLVLIEDPLSGKYMLQLSPDKNTTTISVGQILKDNKEIWKKYRLTGRTHLKFTIHFDRDHPREDPFEHR